MVSPDGMFLDKTSLWSPWCRNRPSAQASCLQIKDYSSEEHTCNMYENFHPIHMNVCMNGTWYWVPESTWYWVPERG